MGNILCFAVHPAVSLYQISLKSIMNYDLCLIYEDDQCIESHFTMIYTLLTCDINWLSQRKSNFKPDRKFIGEKLLIGIDHT